MTPLFALTNPNEPPASPHCWWRLCRDAVSYNTAESVGSIVLAKTSRGFLLRFVVGRFPVGSLCSIGPEKRENLLYSSHFAHRSALIRSNNKSPISRTCHFPFHVADCYIKLIPLPERGSLNNETPAFCLFAYCADFSGAGVGYPSLHSRSDENRQPPVPT